eukprot:GHVU01218938.1.p1 GENE.GHVU01218938.1~~GHVU01218938.1.p1  ORF type:complete len:140 (+),score=5.17 GHVU01218938.1:38-457(+)
MRGRRERRGRRGRRCHLGRKVISRYYRTGMSSITVTQIPRSEQGCTGIMPPMTPSHLYQVVVMMISEFSMFRRYRRIRQYTSGFKLLTIRQSQNEIRRMYANLRYIDDNATLPPPQCSIVIQDVDKQQRQIRFLSVMCE